MRNKIAVIVISSALLTGIATHEGFRKNAYEPVKGDVPTVGYGTTTYPDGRKVQLGDVVTKKQAEEYLRHDVYRFKGALEKCIKVPLSDLEAEAYMSLAYNIGDGAFCKSTLVKKLNAYDYKGACDEILKWDKFQGKPLRGLTIRRQQEHKQCLEGFTKASE
jgi:lysozyme